MPHHLIARARTLREELLALQNSERFMEYPLQVRTAFIKIQRWLSDREASLLLENITAASARMLRDRAARERGWRFGNQTLVLLNIVVMRAVSCGILSKNRIRQVSKIPPPFRPTNERRPLKSIRHRIDRTLQSSEAAKSG